MELEEVSHGLEKTGRRALLTTKQGALLEKRTILHLVR